MEEYIGLILGVIAAIIGIILLVKFVIFLFVNFVISRILSIGTAIAALVLGFVIFPAVESGENLMVAPFFATIILTTVSWMFFAGEFVFAEFDSDEIEYFDWKNLEIVYKKIGGFFLNLVCSFAVSCFLYGIVGAGFPAVCFVIPALLLLANAIAIIRYINSR